MYPEMSRKKRVPGRPVPNTYRIFHEDLSDVSLDPTKFNPPVLSQKSEKSPPHPRSPNRNNMPHPFHAKCIHGNVRFIHEPITYVGTAGIRHKQTEWWPKCEENVTPHRPSYDRTSTQRRDFSFLVHSSRQTRHGCNPHKAPLCGIVPLASPRSRNRLPKLFQEEVSFLHQYDSRLSPNEPIRGKRHGGFVWREIKRELGPGIPLGTGPFLNATGSHEQPQRERGNSLDNNMTSPRHCMLGSQQMLHSEAKLSKTEQREAAKTSPNATAGERNGSDTTAKTRRQNSSDTTASRKALTPIGESRPSPPKETPE